MGDATPSKSLLDAIRAAAKPTGPICSVLNLTRNLAGQDLADFHAVIDDRSIPASAVGKVLRERNYDIGDYPLRRHRNKECSCRR